MNNIFYVYQLRAENDPNPFYIGKGKDDRVKDHFRPSSLKQNTYKNNKIKKLQSEGVKILVEYLYEGLSEEESLSLEESLIEKYGIHRYGGILTNRTLGGQGLSGFRHSEETKAKMGAANRGLKRGPEVRALMASKKIGTKTRPRTEEEKRKISEALAGVPKGPHSEEEKRKIAQSLSLTQWNKNPEFWVQVEEIFQLHQAGLTPKQIAESLQLNFNTVHNLKFNRFKRGWVPSEDPVYQEWKGKQR